MGQGKRRNRKLEPLSEAYQLLDLGEFNEEVFQELIAFGINGIAQEYAEQINEHLLDLFFEHPLLQNPIRAGTKALINNLETELKKIKNDKITQYYE